MCVVLYFNKMFAFFLFAMLAVHENFYVCQPSAACRKDMAFVGVVQTVSPPMINNGGAGR